MAAEADARGAVSIEKVRRLTVRSLKRLGRGFMYDRFINLLDCGRALTSLRRGQALVTQIASVIS